MNLIEKVKFSIFFLSLLLPLSGFCGDNISFTQIDNTETKELVGLDIDPKHFTVSNISIELIREEVMEGKKLATDLGEIVLIIDKLLAVGKKIWQIIDAGKPSISAQFNPISVLPNFDDSELDDPNQIFSNMFGWSLPVIRTYRVVYRNLYNVKVIEFEFSIIFQHSGKYNDKGKYLTGINVVAGNISTTWGFKMDAKSKLLTITNMGQSLNDPLAAASFQIDYIAKSVLKEIQSSVVFHVVGDGRIIKLN